MRATTKGFAPAPQSDSRRTVSPSERLAGRVLIASSAIIMLGLLTYGMAYLLSTGSFLPFLFLLSGFLSLALICAGIVLKRAAIQETGGVFTSLTMFSLAVYLFAAYSADPDFEKRRAAAMAVLVLVLSGLVMGINSWRKLRLARESKR